MIACLDDFRSSNFGSARPDGTEAPCAKSFAGGRGGQKSKGHSHVSWPWLLQSICERLGCSDRYSSLWKERFQQELLSVLDSRYRGAKYRRQNAEIEASVLELTQRKPVDGSTHWCSSRLANEVGINQSTVSPIWPQFGLQPHRLRRYLSSNDPEFEEKAADIIGLYLKPPVHAAVFCVNEKSAIQALDRLHPVLPLSPGRAERHGFEYYRHGPFHSRRSEHSKWPSPG